MAANYITFYSLEEEYFYNISALAAYMRYVEDYNNYSMDDIKSSIGELLNIIEANAKNLRMVVP